jgi:molybdopterin molybdotransferase
MITVEQAENIIRSNGIPLGSECIDFNKANGRILAEAIFADRDIPPYNRVTMDGIAICYLEYEKGKRKFKISSTLAAGELINDVFPNDECIEIMTGAALPLSYDTVIRYEDLLIENGSATIVSNAIKKSQNIQPKGIDKKEQELLVSENEMVDAAVIATAASVGSTKLLVKKTPTIIIITTGNEVVGITDKPLPHQIRTSNSFAINALLEQYRLYADSFHVQDEPQAIKQKLSECLQQYEAIIITGGVSAGKHDHVPHILKELQVTELFHIIAQRPGKPFWFGKNEKGVLVFAFPGNPVSSFLCTIRYLIPWLQASLGMKESKYVAVLNKAITFTPALQYFLPVNVCINDEGKLIAAPVDGNGSGDYLQLLKANAFMELPMNKENFNKGEIYRIWYFMRVHL